MLLSVFCGGLGLEGYGLGLGFDLGLEAQVLGLVLGLEVKSLALALASLALLTSLGATVNWSPLLNNINHNVRIV